MAWFFGPSCIYTCWQIHDVYDNVNSLFRLSRDSVERLILNVVEGHNTVQQLEQVRPNLLTHFTVK